MATETIQTIQTRTDILGVLIALSESGYWSEREMSIWATEVLTQTNEPSAWLIDLVMIENSSNLEQLFHKAMLDHQITLPEWTYALAAGFLLVRHENGDLSDEQAKDHLADLIDPEPICGITIEDVADVQLDSARLRRVRQEASSLLGVLKTKPVIPAVLASISA